LAKMYITDLSEEDIEIAIKVLIVGNGAVGKSSMIQRYCRGTFTKSYKKTIGVDFLEKQLRVQSEEVRLMLWDTAGQEEFDALTKSYYRGAQACVFAFSTTDRASLLAIRKWRKKVEDECGDIPMVLVQNKIDLISQSEIDQLEAERLAAECNMKLYRTSVKEDLNVAVVFQHLAENYVNKVRSTDSIDSGFHSLSIGNQDRQSLLIPTTTPTYHGRSRSKSREKERRQSSGIRVRAEGGRRFSNYRVAADPCADYLSNPMFDRLHSRGRYWPGQGERGIVLKPMVLKKYSHGGKPLSGTNKGGCKVL